MTTTRWRRGGNGRSRIARTRGAAGIPVVSNRPMSETFQARRLVLCVAATFVVAVAAGVRARP
jgi:hypothetical protein